MSKWCFDLVNEMAWERAAKETLCLQCECGGAFIEIKGTHLGPIYCGELGCGMGISIELLEKKT